MRVTPKDAIENILLPRADDFNRRPIQTQLPEARVIT
jgi:hypothetical protein